MKKWILCLGVISLSSNCLAQNERPKSEKDRVNYSVGYQIGGDFKRQGIELDPQMLVQGIRDALEGNQRLLTEDEMRRTLVDLKKRIVSEEANQRQVRVETLREQGREFLSENSGKEGVVTLPSGLQYKVLQEGTGERPTPGDAVTVNYRGAKLDGTEFDSSYKLGKPATFSLSKVIAGWKEALPMMKEGAKWQLFVPAGLAFRDKGPLEEQTVIYEIELVKIGRSENDSNR